LDIFFLTERRISGKSGGKLACRRIGPLNPHDGRRPTPGSMRMISAAPMARRAASAPSLELSSGTRSGPAAEAIS